MSVNMLMLEKRFTHLIVFASHHMACFDFAEVFGISSGQWMPDFFDDYPRWFCAQCLKLNAASKVLGTDANLWKRPVIEPRVPEFKEPDPKFRILARYGLF